MALNYRYNRRHIVFGTTSKGTPGPQRPKGDPGPRGPKGDPGNMSDIGSNLDLKNNKIINLAPPVGNDDGANKSYVDSKVSGISSLSNNLNMNDHKIENLSTPTGDKDSANKKYVDDGDAKTLADSKNYTLGVAHVKVSVDGGSTMSGNLNMGNHKIENMSAPTTDTDGANKKYVDDNVGHYTVTGNLDMKNNKIVNLSTPGADKDVSNKEYVDNEITTLKNNTLNTDGSKRMQGNLDLNSYKIIDLDAPTGNSDAVNKKYVDDKIAAIPSSPSGGGSPVGSKNLNMNNHKIENLGAATVNSDAVNKKYVDDKIAAIPSGGSSVGSQNLDMNNHKIENLGAPTGNSDGANKKYVDDADAKVLSDSKSYTLGIAHIKVSTDGGSVMSGNLNMGNHKIENLAAPTGNSDGANKKYVDDKNSGVIRDDGSNYMKANFNMNSKRIMRVARPTATTDAANKKYVDDQISAIPSGSGGSSGGNNPATKDLDMNNYNIKNLPLPPQGLSDAAYKKYAANTEYVNTEVNFVKVNLAKKVSTQGDSLMTGDLNMNSHKVINLVTPTANTDASTKKYTDDAAAKSLADGKNFTNRVFHTKVSADGSTTMSGDLNVGRNRIVNISAPTADNNATNKKYVDDQIASVRKSGGGSGGSSGGLQTGDLNMNNYKIINLSAPSSQTDATTKEYVDYKIQESEQLTRTHELDMGNLKIVNLKRGVLDSDAATKKYVDEMTGSKLSTAYGGGMNGSIDMNGPKILNLADPVFETDTATKKYVDNKILNVDEKNVVILDKNRYRVKYTGGTYQGFAFILSGRYSPNNDGWETDFRWNPYSWSKVPLMGNQKSIHFSDSPLNGKHTLVICVDMPNKYWTANKNFGITFATKFTGNNTVSSTSLQVIDNSGSAEVMDIKKLGNETVNGETFEIYLGFVTHRGNNVVSHMKIEFNFTGSGNESGYVYHGFIFDGYDQTKYNAANITNNKNFPHFPGFDQHKFVDSTVGDILLAGVNDSAADTVTVEKLRISESNLTADVIKLLNESKKKYFSTVLRYDTLPYNTKIYTDTFGIAFPVTSTTKTIKMQVLTHNFDGNSSIPVGFKIEFGAKFYINGSRPKEKMLVHLTYSNYAKDTTGVAIINVETFTKPPANCIGVDFYIRQVAPLADIMRKSNMLVNYILE